LFWTRHIAKINALQGQTGRWEDEKMRTHSDLQMRLEGERLQFRLIFAVCFLCFLAAALIQRLLPRDDFSSAAAQKSPKSILDEAKAIANRTIPFAFMG
jgi:hypothetical protein